MPTTIALAAVPTNEGTLSDALQSVAEALPSSSESNAAKVRILDFVGEHPDALFRTCFDGHLTGSALVVDADRERVLLMLHAKLKMWLQPGGHADGNGHLAAVALREAEEETGIVGLRVAAPAVDCDVHNIPARPGEPEHLHLDVRHVVLAPPDAVVVGNHESHALEWFLPSELDDIVTDNSLVRLARVGLELAQTL